MASLYILLTRSFMAVFEKMRLEGHVESMADSGLIKKDYCFNNVDRDSAEKVLKENPGALRRFNIYIGGAEKAFLGYFLASKRIKEEALGQLQKRLRQLRRRFPDIECRTYQVKNYKIKKR